MKNSNKTLTYASGIILIILGALFIISPKSMFESIVWITGVIIIALSIISIATSLSSKNVSSYFLVSSLLGLILGIVLLYNREGAIKIIPILLGIYLLITGISKLIIMAKANYKYDIMFPTVIKIVLGSICLFTPVIPIVITGIIIGIFLILTGITNLSNIKTNEVVYKVKVKK